MDFTHIAWRYTGCANMNFIRQGLKAFESYRLTYIEIDRQRIDQNYKPHRFVGGQKYVLCNHSVWYRRKKIAVNLKLAETFSQLENNKYLKAYFKYRYCNLYSYNIFVQIVVTVTSATERGRTEEGLDYMFASNYVGHFLLTMLLLGKYMKCINLLCTVQNTAFSN